MAEKDSNNPTTTVNLVGQWLPIAQADKTITSVQEYQSVGITLRNSDTYWVRDEDGRTYKAAWSEGENGRDYWWDWEAESPVDPVEFMPHPLDKRCVVGSGWICQTCNGTGKEGRHSICRDCDDIQSPSPPQVPVSDLDIQIAYEAWIDRTIGARAPITAFYAGYRAALATMEGSNNG